MKVLALRADRSGCGWYRITAPAQEMRRAGRDVVVSQELDVTADRYRDGSVKVLEIKADADRIVFQRPVTQQMYAAVVKAREQGYGVTVELDDNFDLIHPGHLAHQQVRATGHGYGSAWENSSWLRQSVRAADRLVVSTPALADHYGSSGQTLVVVENAMPPLALEVANEPGRVGSSRSSLGWSGVVGTHVGDLEVTRGAAGQVAFETGWGLWAVGDGTALPVLAGNRALDSGGPAGGWSPWTDSMVAYYRALGRITVGLVPLVDSEFNRCKSDIKGQEFALLTGSGRAVASRIGEYARLHGAGSPVLTTKNRYSDWVRSLGRTVALHVSEGPRSPEQRVLEAKTLDPEAWWAAWTGETG